MSDAPARMPRWLPFLLAVLALAVGAAWLAKDHVLPETAPAVRGAEVARELGCWDCHGDAARAPSLFGGSSEPSVLRARIRGVPGHPPDLADDAVEDLAAWIALVQHDGLRTARRTGATPEWRAVELLASRQCFGCHGELGQGGVANPGSLKGYVPGFFGRDYDVLTRGGDPEVVRQWIRDGVPHFFRGGIGRLRPALWFTERQQVKMPAYAQSLRHGQVEALVAYLTVLRGFGPLDAEAIAAYRARMAEGRPGG